MIHPTERDILDFFDKLPPESKEEYGPLLEQAHGTYRHAWQEDRVDPQTRIEVLCALAAHVFKAEVSKRLRAHSGAFADERGRMLFTWHREIRKSDSAATDCDCGGEKDGCVMLANGAKHSNSEGDTSYCRDEHFVARFYGVSLGTVRRWRVLGMGLRYRKIGALVRYSITDLMFSWVAMERIYEREVLPDAKLRKQAGERPLRAHAKRLTDGELLARLRSYLDGPERRATIAVSVRANSTCAVATLNWTGLRNVVTDVIIAVPAAHVEDFDPKAAFGLIATLSDRDKLNMEDKVVRT